MSFELTEFNPWWETGSIDREYSGLRRRHLFYLLRDNLDRKYIDVIIGLRRVGKTVLMYHLIDELINRGVDPKRILYFSFDIARDELSRIIRMYEEKILHDRIRDKRVYVFLDEIHKLMDWGDKIKVLYDLNPRIKIVLSGSASLNLMKSGRESLAGRARFYTLPPLTFKEFIEFNGIKAPSIEDYEIYRARLNILLNKFLLRGFPETINMSDKEAENYIRELIVERILYRDIPESFRVEDIEIIRILAEYIFRRPGVILNIDSLSRNLGRHKKTIRNALNYLELSFLIKRLYNLRGSFLASSRKYKKAYPIHPSLSINRSEDILMETLVRSELDAGYYWRKGGYEVDFILKNEEIVPIEVKWSERIDKENYKGLLAFLRLYNFSRGFIISREFEDKIKVDNKVIEIIPMLKFLLWRELR